MSTAKMVADSTVTSDLPSVGRRRRNSSERKQSKKLKKSICEEASKNESEDSDSDLDLSKDLFSVGGYIKDRPEMVEQMFRAVRGPSLRRALPDILLDLPLDDLKQRCLEQLEIMSRKRILRILDGDIPAEISSSGTEDSSGEDVGVDEDGEQNSTVSSDQDQAEEENKEDVEEAIGSEEGSDEEEEFEEAIEEGIDEEAEEEEMDQFESGDEMEGSVEEEAVNEMDGVESSASENCEEETVDESQCLADSSEAEQSVQHSIETCEGKSPHAPTLTKEQMEILELEMRARAIKAMLNKHPKTLVPMSPIDNTKKAQEIDETVKHDVRRRVQEGTTCTSSKAQKERPAKKKTETHSLHVHNASLHLDGKTMKRSKRKSADSCHFISKSSVPQERLTPTGGNERDEDSNSADHTINSAIEFEPEDGEVASEGEIIDNQDNSNLAVLSGNEESEHSMDSSTTTL